MKNGLSKDTKLPILPSEKMCSPHSVRQVSVDKDREAFPVIFNNNVNGTRVKRKKDIMDEYDEF